MDVRRTETSLLVGAHKDDFRKTGLFGLLSVLAWGDPLIFSGPKGSGKTLTVEEWAFENNFPFIRFDCTGETGDRRLLGGFVLKSLEESWFALGVLPTAIDVANEVGACILCLEEINALNEEAQKSVNPVADYRQEVNLHVIGMRFRINPPVVATTAGTVVRIEEEDEYTYEVLMDTADSYSVKKLLLLPSVKVGAKMTEGQRLGDRPRLWLVGAMNYGKGYGGTYELNEDFRSRCRIVNVDFMTDRTEQDILHGKFPGTLTAGEKVYVKGLQTLARETRGGKLGYSLSTRDLEQAIHTYLQFKVTGASEPESMMRALKVLEGKFPQRSWADYQARVKSVFRDKYDISSTTLY